MMKSNTWILAAILLLAILFLTGCLPGTVASTAGGPANFFQGVWHGWMAPFSLIGHFFFDSSIRIYEVQNIGIWYDLGFYIAVISGFGGISFFRRKKK